MSHEAETVPVDETYEQTFDHHGRTYQRYAVTNNTYFGPTDEDEISRLSAFHASVLGPTFDNRLVYPRVRRLHRVLDCGCGAGIWATAVAEEHPDAEVLGIDISPQMLPTDDLPDNVIFELDDLNHEFNFGHKRFDLINSQFVNGGIDTNRWRPYIKNIHQALRPGGWCQMVEMYPNAQSDNGSLTRGSALSRWSERYLEAISPFKDPRAGRKLDDWLRRRGFEQVQAQKINLPMCGWSRDDARDREIGTAMADQIGQLLYSLGLYPMTRLRGMTLADFEALVAEATIEARDVRIKPYFEIYVCIGRRPS